MNTFAEEIPSNELVVIKNPTYQGLPLVLDVRCEDRQWGETPEHTKLFCFWYQAQAWSLCEFMGFGKPVPSLWLVEEDPNSDDFSNRNRRDGMEITCSLYSSYNSNSLNCDGGHTVVRPYKYHNMITQLACMKRLPVEN